MVAVASDNEDFLSVQKCPVCGIQAFCAGNQKKFYWSHSETEATSNEVASKVCRYAKFAGKKGCINTAGEYVKNLDWGQNEYDFLVEERLSEFDQD